MIKESQLIAGLLLTQPSKEQWDDAIVNQNILQKRSPASAKRGIQETMKLGWNDLKATSKDKITIEHIFPQTPSNQYWQERFGSLNKEQTTWLANSLGNLVPLSRAKNSSLQNDGFDDKKNNGAGVGYYNGSAAENEIAQLDEWLPESILSRGLTLFEFMEKRWNISLGDEQFKTQLLHLDFISERSPEEREIA
ncbi:hypothetical protein A0J46_08040 [Photobacterium damselae subsp. damselae]|nr:hypothetical protein A0J46_08040 [Photobacterium damselae subsp. damselae]